MQTKAHLILLACAWNGLFSCSANAEWQRVARVAVYDSPRRARYPSVAKAKDGSILVVFTRQTAEQEKMGRGELVLVRSGDEGQTWSSTRTIYKAQNGVPRAVGTLTRRRNGNLILPVVTLTREQTNARVEILTSTTSGQRWKSLDTNFDVPLAWWAPRGKIIDKDGVLVMPVYGATTHSDLKRTVHHCGILRSRDGGKNWGDFSWIAQGAGSVIGAAANSRFSFEGPCVSVLPDGRWLALVTARRLNKAANGPSRINAGPGAPHVVCRVWSRDQGRTWSRPDQLMPGAWPDVTVAGDHALCANTLWCGWGEIRLEISRNGFQTLFQEVRMMTREWTRGMANRPQETPLPPTVPYLADAWPYEHYGYPSMLSLDDRNVLVVFTDEQRGTAQIDGPQSQSIPYDRERIQAVFYRRKPNASESRQAASRATKHHRPKGRWVLAERMMVPDLGGAMAQLPRGHLIAKVKNSIRRSGDGGRTWQPLQGNPLSEKLGQNISALGILKSGRWLAATVQVNKPWTSKGGPQKVGMVGGFPTFKLAGESYDASIVVHRSNDEGKTWKASQPFKGPLKWALPTVSHFLESPDGTVALPIFGCVTNEEMSSYSASNGVIRSRDGGQTWGDFSFAFRTGAKGPEDHQPEPRYSEMDIVQLPNNHWVACSRHERITMGPAGWGANALAISKNFGRTWTSTGGSLVGVSQQKAIALPNGGFALTWRATSWQSSGVAISYDEGRSFDYLLTGPYETVNAFVTGPNEFVVFTANSRRSDSSAGVYRWVAR